MISHLLQVGESAVVVRPAGLAFLRPEQLSHHPFFGGGRLTSAGERLSTVPPRFHTFERRVDKWM
jgi:hypothetical protein